MFAITETSQGPATPFAISMPVATVPDLVEATKDTEAIATEDTKDAKSRVVGVGRG